MLRIKELCLAMDELEFYTVGDITDMMIERSNDTYDWELKPTQADFDRFMR